MKLKGLTAGSTLICLLLLSTALSFRKETPGVPQAYHHPQQDSSVLRLADPTIFFHNGVYYLYGTGGGANNGFLVYTSTDLKRWEGPAGAAGGFALRKGDAYGSKGFWAPQVFYHSDKFYMAYTADENIAIAESQNPLGPFRQAQIRPISGAGKQIDPFVFFDEGGRIFLFHVRLTEGNRIFMARLKDDLSDIDTGSVRSVLSATAEWENTARSGWPVAEGPTVLRHGGQYYLFYSANDFRNKDYAVGYATSRRADGPWTKYSGNPVLHRTLIGKNGTGHGDFFSANNKLYYVFHTHASDTSVQPRLTALISANFVRSSEGPEKLVFDTSSFAYLHLVRKPEKD